MDISQLGLLTDEEAAELRGLHEELGVFVRRMPAGYLQSRLLTLVERAEKLAGKVKGVGELIDAMTEADRKEQQEHSRAARAAGDLPVQPAVSAGELSEEELDEPAYTRQQRREKLGLSSGGEDAR